MKKRVVKIISFFFALVIFCSSFVFAISAEKIENPMLSTYVVDDLKTMGFNLADYPKDESSKSVSIMEFLEYGFDSNGDHRYYGLYVYVYNPSGASVKSDKHYIQIGIENPDSEKNIVYQKYPLSLLSVSKDVDNKGVFLKFKVEGFESALKQLSTAQRIYNISGIEINFSNFLRQDDYPISQKWTYKGFQYNFGSNDPNGSLNSHVSKIETVSIKLGSDRWFSATSEYGKYFRYEVSSVYFAIPNYIINEYGNISDPNGTSGLVSVQGSYNKYGLNGLIVESEAAYNAWEPYRNLDRIEFYKKLYSSSLSLEEKQQVNLELLTWPGFCDYTYNDFTSKTHVPKMFKYHYEPYGTVNQEACKDLFQLYIFNLLSRGDYCHISTSDMMKLWEESGKPFIYDSSELYMGQFAEGIGIQKHYYDISVFDGNLNSSIKSYASSFKGIKWLDKLLNKKLWVDEKGYGYECKPLVEANDSFFGLSGIVFTDERMCNQYYLSQDGYNEFNAFYKENALNNHVYLMRFAVDPYFCTEITGHYIGKGTDPEAKGYYYEKVIYDNFDVLSFTFKGENGKITVVPVNCKPITIIGSVVIGSNVNNSNPNNVEEPYTFWDLIQDLFEFFKSLKIFPILLGILVVVLIFKIGWPILKNLGNLGLDIVRSRASNPKEKSEKDKSPPKKKSSSEKIDFKLNVKDPPGIAPVNNPNRMIEDKKTRKKRERKEKHSKDEKNE